MALVALPAPPSPPVPEPELDALVVLVVLVALVALADEPETATGFTGSVVSHAAMPKAPTTAMDHAARRLRIRAMVARPVPSIEANRWPHGSAPADATPQWGSAP
jgi:hypothetical protein